MAQHLAEQRGEDLRLAYVALTRAQHQAVVWWAGSWNSRDSALGRLLFARAEDGTVPAAGRATPTDAAAVARFEALAATAPGCVSVERAVLGLPVEWSGPPRAPGGARRVALRPRAGPALAADVLQRHHGGHARGPGRERAGGGRRDRRAGAPEPAVPRGGRRGRCAARHAVAAGRDAGRRARRHVRAPRARGDRLRRARPRRRADRPGRAHAGAPPRGDRGPGGGRGRAAGGDRDAARPARRRPAAP